MSQVAPILIVVFFWALIFCFSFLFFARSLRVPTEGEEEAREAEHAASADAAHAPHAASQGAEQPMDAGAAPAEDHAPTQAKR